MRIRPSTLPLPAPAGPDPRRPGARLHAAASLPAASAGRRALLARGLAGMLAAAAPAAWAKPRTEVTRLELDPLPQPAARELAPGAWWVPGLPGEVDGRNVGRQGNTGFFVGPEGVIAVDSGVSRRHGEALLAQIAAVTDRPVRLLLITHARQEFVFGAAAFRARGIPVGMQRGTAGLMASRCQGCLDTLVELLGEAHMEGTALLKPDLVFDGPQRLLQAGRPLELLSWGHSSGPGDSAVFDPATGALFAGGLCDHRRVPDLQDSRLQGWRDALAALRALRPRHLVPGHGPAGGPELVDAVEDYLRILEGRLAGLLDQGVPLSEVADRAELPDYRTWDQYEPIHRRNAAMLFLRLEHAQLLR